MSLELDDDDLEMLGYGSERRLRETSMDIARADQVHQRGGSYSWFGTPEALEGRRRSTSRRNRRYREKHKAELAARNRTPEWLAYQREWQRAWRARKKLEAQQ